MHILYEIVIVLALAAIVVFLGQKLRLPAIVGFLVTGVVVGPSSLGLISDPETVEMLAEIGIVLLMFTIGMEFSLNQLFSIRKTVFAGGLLQVFLTLAVCAGWALAMGRPSNQAVFIGLMLAMSSTAIVLKLLAERAEVDTPHGRVALGVLIFQDILIVPAMLVVPLLSGSGLDAGGPMHLLLAKVLLAVPSVWLLAKYIVPLSLKQVAATRNQELFMLSILVIGFAIAGLSEAIGLKLALGAFLAGLIISESEYSHQALGAILPFRDVFLSFFFISVGLLLDVGFLFDHLGTVLLIAGGVLLLKTITGAAASAVLGHPLRTALLAGLALSQVGEFSLLLSKTGLEAGIIQADTYQLFLAVVILTMAAAPVAIGLGPRVVGRVATRINHWRGKTQTEAEPETAENNHLLIVGFGLNGRNLATAAKKCGISHAIIEMNPDTVHKMKKEGIPIHYGDASNEMVLAHAGVSAAKVAVIAINDAAATRRIVELLRRRNPKLHIIARTRFMAEVPALYGLGANEVIPEEFETSIEIFARVMRRYLISREQIERFIADIRADGYQMLRAPSGAATAISPLQPVLEQVDIESARVQADSPVVGLPLSELRIRTDFGVTVLAIQRQNELRSNPDGEERLCAGDSLVLMGKSEQLRAFTQRIAAYEPSDSDSDA